MLLEKILYKKEKFKLRLIDLIIVSVLNVILFSSAIFLPAIGFFFYFFSILPFIYLILNYGYKKAFFSLLISCAGIYVLWGVIYTLFFFLVCGSIGLFFGYSIKKKYSASWLVLEGSLLCFVMLCLFEISSLLFFRYDVLGQVLEFFRIYNNHILEFYKKGNLPPDDLRNILSFLKEKMVFLENIIFSIIFLNCFLGIFMFYKLAQFSFAKIGYCLNNLPLFSSWRPQEKLVFGFIAGGGIYCIGFYSDFESTKFFGQNILVIFLAVYFINGLSLLNYFLKKYKIQKMTSYLIYVLTIVQPILLLGFGLLDVWIDFRKKPKEGKIGL